MTEDIVKEVEKDIKKYKRLLLAKAKKSGITENFGDKYMRALNDKYSPVFITDWTIKMKVLPMIQNFEEWCISFDLSYIQ